MFEHDKTWMIKFDLSLIRYNKIIIDRLVIEYYESIIFSQTGSIFARVVQGKLSKRFYGKIQFRKKNCGETEMKILKIVNMQKKKVR